MADNPTISYPDVFGYITDVPRVNVNVVQIGVACRPRIVRAGRQFEVITLIQNLSDAAVDVTLNLQIPEKDAAGQKGRFIAAANRLVIGLNPAEVGYATLPISTMPDTAISNQYTIGLDISAKPLEKPRRIRDGKDKKPFRPQTATNEAQQEIAGLRQLKFAPPKRGFLRSDSIEARFAVLEGKVGMPLNIKPGWISLWTLESQEDIELLINKYMDVMWRRVLPALKRDRLYPPLLELTVKRFEAAGYPLNELESTLIAKLMALLVEYAGPGDAAGQGGTAAGAYNVYGMLKSRRARMGKSIDIGDEDEHAPMPEWTKAFLRALIKDERIAGVPHKAIPHFAYEALLHDAIIYSFKVLERDTGEDLGDEDEMQTYAQQVIARFKQKNRLDFSYVYLPLVLGAVLVADRSLVGDERLTDVMKPLRDMLDARDSEHDDGNEAVFEMCERTIALALRKYGMLDNR